VTLDAVRVDLAARPIESLRIFGDYRYDGVRNFELARYDPQYHGPGYHADLWLSWDVTGYLSLGVDGGFAQDFDNHLARGFVGPQVGLPRLFGAHGGLSVGYAEEFGWLAGRNAYVQTILSPAPRWQVMARLSYFQDTPEGNGVETHELGLSASASAPILSWLSARLSVAGRLGLDQAASGAESDLPVGGIVVSVGLRGEL
jgi:hypothetical protein